MSVFRVAGLPAGASWEAAKVILHDFLGPEVQSTLRSLGLHPQRNSLVKGHERVVNMLLRQESVKVDLEDSSGKTPLMYAVGAANGHIVHALLNHGASAARIDYEQKGMLHHAIVNADSDLRDLEVLISHGAPTRTVT